MDYYSVIGRNHTVKCITLRERAQTEKSTCCGISVTWHSAKGKNRAEKQIAKDWGQTTELTIEVAQENFSGDGNVLHLDCGDGYTAVCVYQNTELYMAGGGTLPNGNYISVTQTHRVSHSFSSPAALSQTQCRPGEPGLLVCPWVCVPVFDSGSGFRGARGR